MTLELKNQIPENNSAADERPSNEGKEFVTA